MRMTKEQFREGIIARAKVLRELGVLGEQPVRRTRIAKPCVQQGRPPKQLEEKGGYDLADAFDEIEAPLEEEEEAL